MAAAAARRVVAAAGGGAVLVGGTVAALTGGLRWQLAPVFATAVLVAPFAVAPLLPRRPGRTPRRARRWLAVPASAVCLLLVAAGPAAAWAFPVPEFPRPTGPYAVGTRVVEWTDGQRPSWPPTTPTTGAPWSSSSGTRPSPPPGPLAPATWGGRRRSPGRSPTPWPGTPGSRASCSTGARARTRAVPDAAVAARGGRFPVVLFSPGLGGVRGQNTAWAEELASHGYVVAASTTPTTRPPWCWPTAGRSAPG
ncbi:hypothetical protein ACFQ1I_05490 [Kitasatospora arboriphila]